MKPIFDVIDAEIERSLAELFELLRIPSVSARGENMRPCAEALARHAQSVGLDAELLESSGPPALLATSPHLQGAPTLLFYGHYDVHPPEPLDAWTTPPFEPTRREGRIYARGAGDNKGQHFAHLKAVDVVRRIRGSLPLNVVLFVDGEEEVGSPHLPELVLRHSDRLRADVAVTADGSFDASGKPCVVFGVRGMLYVELRARGARRDLHSGNFGGLAPNPAWRLVELLSAIRRADGCVTIPGFEESVRPLTRAERSALDALPFPGGLLREMGVDRFAGDPALSPWEKLLCRPTANVAGIVSGWTGSGPKTIVPASATAKMDFRLVPDQDPDRLFDALVSHASTLGFGDVDIKKLQAWPPSRTPLDDPFGRAAIRAVERAWGVAPLVYPSLGASLPHFLFTRELGMPSVLVPYANPDQSNHAPNENLTIEAFRRGIRTSAALMLEVAGIRG
ncbi:MAG: M20/M25/M40 family metallo-hydrolase [Planctomycetes bacterium]|nr:M20/M25/M40 family metallo-hydrolase [Planctomycetota bacterium]